MVLAVNLAGYPAVFPHIQLGSMRIRNSAFFRAADSLLLGRDSEWAESISPPTG